MIARASLLAAVAIAAGGGVASGQTLTPAYRPWNVTFAAGITSQGGYPIGDINADLRRNAMGPAQAVPLFRAESKIERTAVADLRLAIAITRLVAVEVSGLFAQPQLTVDITGDVEANEPASAGERVTQYAVEVSGVVLLPAVNLGSRARAYVLGGGGYLRQLHEGRLAVDTGRTLHAGAGVQYWLRGGTNPRQHAVGIRGEARVVHRVGGIDYEERARNFPAVGALLFVGF